MKWNIRYQLQDTALCLVFIQPYTKGVPKMYTHVTAADSMAAHFFSDVAHWN